MLMDGLVGGLCGGDGLFLQTFADLFGLLGCGFQFGSKFVLLVVSTFCCFHKYFPFLIYYRIAVAPSQQHPDRSNLSNQACIEDDKANLTMAGTLNLRPATYAGRRPPIHSGEAGRGWKIREANPVS